MQGRVLSRSVKFGFLSAPSSTRVFCLNFSTCRAALYPKIQVENCNINYEVFGHGPHAVFCIPGLIGSIELDFGKFLERVDTSKFRWVAWDPPGYGKSRPPDRDFGDSCYLNDAILAGKLLKHLDIEKYSVFGWSQGSGTAMFLAGQCPENVINLVTVGAKACYDAKMIRVFEVMSMVEYFPEEYLKERLKVYDMLYLKKMLKENLANVKRSFNNPRERGDYLKSVFDKIQCPVLYVHGNADKKVPLGHANQLARRTRNARTALIPGAGHELHLTHTDEFLKHAEPFLLNES